MLRVITRERRGEQISRHGLLSSPDAIRKLRIGDQESRDAARVQLLYKGVDLWVHDRLAHQRQRAMPRLLHAHKHRSVMSLKEEDTFTEKRIALCL